MFPRSFQHLLPAAATVLLLGAAASADVSLPPIFSKGVVLQAEARVPVWGTAEPGERVTVSFAGQTRAATADKDGRWQATLEPLRAGTSGAMTVTGAKPVVIEDVLVGEVWLCSGQSNMEGYVMHLGDQEKLLAEADLPELRLFRIEKEATPQPAGQVHGRWVKSAPKGIGLFSAVGYLFGRSLHRDLKTPVGMIQATWGGTVAASWTPMDTLKSDPAFAPILEAGAKLGQGPRDFADAKSQGDAYRAKPDGPAPVAPDKFPARIYNGMITPLAPYRLRGIIWYQGESDAYQAAMYRKTFPAMIGAWRQRWGRDDLPFLYVQLPGYRLPDAQPPRRSFWAELREVQLQTLAVPHTAMTVTIDIGSEDIHPKNKYAVADRLSRLALAKVYGKDIAHQGPFPGEIRFDGDKAIVSFKSKTGDLTTQDGKPMRGFALAGKDQQWKWAQAAVEGDTVVAHSPDVPAPTAVRYDWSERPEGNLTDGTHLPCTPFRSDNW